MSAEELRRGRPAADEHDLRGRCGERHDQKAEHPDAGCLELKALLTLAEASIKRLFKSCDSLLLYLKKEKV